MTDEELQIRLYQKMGDEQSRFRDWLLTQPQEEVLNHAYEYSVREDILLEVGEMELSAAQAKALLKSPDALSDIYKSWSNRDSCDYMEDIADTITARADEVKKNQVDTHGITREGQQEKNGKDVDGNTAGL